MPDRNPNGYTIFSERSSNQSRKGAVPHPVVSQSQTAYSRKITQTHTRTSQERRTQGHTPTRTQGHKPMNALRSGKVTISLAGCTNPHAARLPFPFTQSFPRELVPDRNPNGYTIFSERSSNQSRKGAVPHPVVSQSQTAYSRKITQTHTRTSQERRTQGHTPTRTQGHKPMNALRSGKVTISLAGCTNPHAARLPFPFTQSFPRELVPDRNPNGYTIFSERSPNQSRKGHVTRSCGWLPLPWSRPTLEASLCFALHCREARRKACKGSPVLRRLPVWTWIKSSCLSKCGHGTIFLVFLFLIRNSMTTMFFMCRRNACAHRGSREKKFLHYLDQRNRSSWKFSVNAFVGKTGRFFHGSAKCWSRIAMGTLVFPAPIPALARCPNPKS